MNPGDIPTAGDGKPKERWIVICIVDNNSDSDSLREIKHAILADSTINNNNVFFDEKPVEFLSLPELSLDGNNKNTFSAQLGMLRKISSNYTKPFADNTQNWIAVVFDDRLIFGGAPNFRQIREKISRQTRTVGICSIDVAFNLSAGRGCSNGIPDAGLTGCKPCGKSEPCRLCNSQNPPDVLHQHTCGTILKGLINGSVQLPT